MKKDDRIFTKEQILQSEKYEDQKDLVRALVPDGAEITLEELDQRIQAFKKGRVN